MTSESEWREFVLILAHDSVRKDGLTWRGNLAHAIAHLERAKGDGYEIPNHDETVAQITALMMGDE